VAGAVVDAAGGAPAGLARERTVDGALLEPVSPASFTSAAARTPSASTTTVTSSNASPLQRGAAARRVRAAAPQRRHQSCAGLSELPQSGHTATASSTSSAGAPAGTWAGG